MTTNGSINDDGGSRAVGRLAETAIAHLGLRTEDVEATAAFYERVVGLRRHHDLPGGGLRLGWDSGHHVLDLLPGEAGLDHVGLEICDAGGPAAVATRARDAGATVVETADGFELRDPDENRIELLGRVERTGEHTADTGRRPICLQHVTFATADLEVMRDFYCEALGFRISDRMADEFVWLRSNHDHHTVAIVDVGQSGGLDHHSYDVSGWQDFLVWCDRLANIGVKVSWGPGRHGPGNNLFIMFDDPEGRHIELSAEMERFWDDRAGYQPRTWTPIPDTINLWGGQLASWRSTSGARS